MEDHHIPTRKYQIYGVIGAFFPLATIAIFLRLYSRFRLAHIGWDDISIAVAYVRRVPRIFATSSISLTCTT